ncbi:MAG: Peptidase U32 [Candidatus Gallionella acididurans]|uniref:Ubiquinone biosynthesis protein UbiV n=1 Tax=Candidatus Gallionella acididurans TaxID=1796491 RepID=A0A139BUY9_9PROT|nr:MAG: Peptidase U32 [Candidatus Gallionella acididurans]
MKLALGPVLYYWQRDALFEFYERIAAARVDIVYLGETVCSKRHNFRLEDWLEVAKNLAASGKQVVLSTQALIESESDLKTLRRLAENGSYTVEANDMGAVRLLSGKSFVAGSHINTYNPQTLALLAELGAQRWVIPVEMSSRMLADLLACKPPGMETEVFAYGRLPLAFSARCFTARHYNLPKDDCQFRCLDHAVGLTLKTREGQPFLALNGIQTQSSSVYNLVAELESMEQLGVDVVRVSPQPFHTEKILALFRQRLDDNLSGPEAAQQMAHLMPDQACDGYWHGRPGIEQAGISI